MAKSDFLVPVGLHSEVFFHTSLSESLLDRLGRQKRLTDQVMTLFEARSTHLRCARIRNATQLTSAGLRTLRGHKLVELDVQGLSRATVTDLVACLGDWSVKNLKSLSVSGYDAHNTVEKRANLEANRENFQVHLRRFNQDDSHSVPFQAQESTGERA